MSSMVVLCSAIIAEAGYDMKNNTGLRDGALENLWGGGRAKYTKKKFAQGKIKWKKIYARQLTLKNIHAMA